MKKIKQEILKFQLKENEVILLKSCENMRLLYDTDEYAIAPLEYQINATIKRMNCKLYSNKRKSRIYQNKWKRYNKIVIEKVPKIKKIYGSFKINGDNVILDMQKIDKLEVGINEAEQSFMKVAITDGKILMLAGGSFGMSVRVELHSGNKTTILQYIAPYGWEVEKR